MADPKHTESLESLLAFASHEISLDDLQACIEAHHEAMDDEDEEDDDGDTTNPAHGYPGPIESIAT